MFLSARNNQFKFDLPRNFVPPDLVKKYKPFLNKIPGSLITEPIDAINYGIQSINLPGPAFDPVSQIDYPGFTRKFRSAAPTQELFDKTMTITMQSFDGFLNYWMMLEIFQYYYGLGGNQNQFLPEGTGLQIYDGEGNIFVTIKLKEMIMSGMSALDLNFSSNTIEFETFDVNFSYNIFEVEVNIA